MSRIKLNFTEEAFLLSTFNEFVKCWRSRKRSRLFVESVNGSAFVNFSAFLGHPNEAHHLPARRTQSSHQKSKKKSFRKTQRDNERAAKFQERKRQENAAATAAEGDPQPPVTSSPTAPSVTAAQVDFSFASPTPENISNMAASDTLGPTSEDKNIENIRQQSSDQSSMLCSSSNNESAFEENNSPGLESETSKVEESTTHSKFSLWTPAPEDISKITKPKSTFVPRIFAFCEQRPGRPPCFNDREKSSRWCVKHQPRRSLARDL